MSEVLICAQFGEQTNNKVSKRTHLIWLYIYFLVCLGNPFCINISTSVRRFGIQALSLLK